MMQILSTLGIDQTIFMQMGIFLFVYFFLSSVLFKPYLKAFLKRKEQTVGKTDLAVQFREETLALEEKYQKEARQLNSESQALFEEMRKEANASTEKKLKEARETAKKLLDKTRSEIDQQVQSARGQLEGHIPELSTTIQNQVMEGKA